MIEKLDTQLRRLVRLYRLADALRRGLLRYRLLERDRTLSQRERAEWLHRCCTDSLGAFGIERELLGTPPRSGLLVSNHLSYLDIPVFSAAVPCVFVSKADVADWRIIGRYARNSGAIFVDRASKGDAGRANLEIASRLQDNGLVVLFPEGTTTDGHGVLRFHSSMLQPAISLGATITPCAIRYELSDGDPGKEVCWWGEMALLPHMLNLLGKKQIRATVAFGDPVVAAGDRKALADLLRSEVASLQDALRSRNAAMPTAKLLADR